MNVDFAIVGAGPAGMAAATLAAELGLDTLLIDEQDRVCRKDWKVDVHRARSESKVKLGMPPDTVWDLALRGSRNSPSSALMAE